MRSDDLERTERFFTAIAEEDFGRAVDILAPEYREAFGESVPTLGRGETALPATAALQRVFLILTRQYGSFEGVAEVSTPSEATNLVEAELHFSTTTQVVEIRFDDDGQITELDLQQTYSPPDYADEEAFSERKITVDVGNGGVEGTITVPVGEGLVPGVVLLKGDGRIDRDYTMGPNKPYRDIAEGLATEGIAVLRYDERTLTSRNSGVLGLETIVEDALAAINRLRAVDTVGSQSVFVGGWSFGGMPIPRIIQRDSTVAGGVLLDTPTRNEIWENRGDHRRALLEADWLTDAEREGIEAQAQQFDKAGEDDFGGADQLQGVPVDVLEDFVNYDHGQALRERSAPVLVVGTGRERDTAYETGFEHWRETLSDEDVAFVWCPELNHAFQRGEGTATGLEPTLLHDNVDRRIIEEVAAWVNAEAPLET